MARTLTLHCINCPAEKTFSAPNVDRLLQFIDDSGWNDRAYTAKSQTMPKNHCEGVCPICSNLEEAIP